MGVHRRRGEYKGKEKGKGKGEKGKKEKKSKEKRERGGEEREREKMRKENRRVLFQLAGVPMVGTRRTKKKSRYIQRGLRSKR